MTKSQSVVFVIQASPIEWSGTPSIALRLVDGKTVINWVIEKLKQTISPSQIVVAVPNMPESAIFSSIAQEASVGIFWGSYENVLDRLIGAVTMANGEIFAKIIGQQYFIDIELLAQMIDFLITNELDYVQAPDGFDVHLWGEVATLESLKRVEKEISNVTTEEKKLWQTRPLTYIRTHNFKIGVYKDIPLYPDTKLLQMRETAKKIYEERAGVETIHHSISIGNAIFNRYRIAQNYIKVKDKVLDIACGYGYGSALLSERAAYVIGGDYSTQVIETAKKNYFKDNLSFKTEDITSISFPNNSFDVVVSIETICHVDENLCLSELKRILKPGGILIISSHQNLHGHIPIVPWHLQEYSLEEFKLVLTKYNFEIIKIYGEKLGVITEDEHGEYMIAVCKKAFPQK